MSNSNIQKNVSTEDYSHEPIPARFEDEITEIIGDPEKARKVTKTMMSMQMLLMNSVPPQEVSLLDKMTPEHITAYLEGSELDMRLAHKGNTEKRWFMLAVIAIIAILFGFIVVIFKDNPDVVEKILFTTGGVIVGAMGGFGYAKVKSE